MSTNQPASPSSQPAADWLMQSTPLTRVGVVFRIRPVIGRTGGCRGDRVRRRLRLLPLQVALLAGRARDLRRRRDGGATCLLARVTERNAASKTANLKGATKRKRRHRACTHVHTHTRTHAHTYTRTHAQHRSGGSCSMIHVAGSELKDKLRYDARCTSGSGSKTP